MKKVISIVLALLMMVPVAAMLVPTASATTAEPTTDVSANGGAGKLYYEQNFDDPALADLVDAELAAALGWTAPNDYATLWIEDGAIRILAQYTPSGVYPPTESKWASGYQTRWVKDYDLIKNATVVEYTLTSYRRPAGSESYAVVDAEGNPVLNSKKEAKVIAADGQGSYQGFGAYMEGWSGTDNYLIRFNPNNAGYKNTHKAYDTMPNAADRGTIYWKSGAVRRVDNGAVDTGDSFLLEYLDNPVPTTETDAQKTGYFYNTEYRIKHIIEPHAHRSYTFINDILFEVENIPDSSTANQYVTNGWRDSITKYLSFHAKPGSSLKLDDIKVSEFVPALTISEVMTNGVKQAGKYQWVEITNPGDAAVNVYDYSIHLWNMGNSVSQKIGDKVDTYQAGSGSDVGYFTPGAKTLANGDVFDSPSYENGVLQPGESAIVLLPQTIIMGGQTGVATDEAFNAYLEGLGMPAGTKTFVVNPKDEYSEGTTIANEFFMAHLAGESTTVGILKVNNQSTNGGYDPVAPAIGQSSAYVNAFAESTVIITSKSGGGTNWFGMKLHEMPYDFTNKKWSSASATNANGDNFLGYYPTIAMNGDAWTKSADASYEISYSGWYLDQPHANIQWGFQRFNPAMTRKNAAGEDVYTTPGYVPAECARVASISIYNIGNEDADDMDERQALPVHRAGSVTVKTPQKTGYDVQIWIDGALAIADTNTETTEVSFTAEQMKNATPHTIRVKYYREGSMHIGYQKSEVVDGKYTLRLLAVVNDPDAFDSLGFDIMMAWSDGDKSAIYEVGYVYETVTVTEGGETTTVTPQDLGYDFEYFYAVHIKNIPENLEALEVYSKAIYTIGGEALEAPEGDQLYPVAE